MLDPFSPKGVLATNLPGFEYRPQQGQMAALVEESLKEGGVALIEAGTGTGKSLAYLIPAAKFAMASGRPVVISTNTINLQEQLINKDIPWVKNQIAPDLKAVLVKGWQNYLCLHRYENVLHSPADLLDPGEEGELAALRDWIARGAGEGSRTELPFSPSATLWSKVSAESDTCLRQECPFYDHCFLFKARRAVEGAHLLVVNHHLLFADVAVRDVLGWESEAVLPPYGHVVLDEAHHVEDVATEHLGHRFSELGWRQYVGRVARVGRSGDRRGHLPTLLGRLQTASLQGSPAAQQITEVALPAVDAAHEAGTRFFSALAEWVESRGSSQSGENVWSIDIDAGWLRSVQPAAAFLQSEIKHVAATLDRVASAVREIGDDWKASAQESDALAKRAKRFAEVLEWLVAADDSAHVFWIEVRALARGPMYTLCSAPIEVGSKLSEWMSEGLSSAIFCSATLSVGGSFSYILGRLGIEESHENTPEGRAVSEARLTRTASIDSPFDFSAQAAVYVPSDIPEPSDPAFSQQFVRSLGDLLVASGGRAFVLFTSYAQLKATAAFLTGPLQAAGIPLWVQGDAGRSHLLRSFVENRGSVLFGTDSFWEGVDVQGPELSLVVIARLPFDVPTHPVAQARTNRLVELGQNPFRDYSLPRAALKLKQGFGRLIRAKSDRGVVVIYDRRIISRSYGRVLMSSLPPAPFYVRQQAVLPSEVASRLP